MKIQSLPMRKEKIFLFFPGPYQKPLGMLKFFSLQLQRGPHPDPPKITNIFQNLGGGPFTIVHATLQVPLASGASDLGMAPSWPHHGHIMATSWPHQVC